MPNTGQNASRRLTEGTRKGANTRRGAGRPPGSPNKSRGLVPQAVAKELLGYMEAQLSPDQFEYLKGVVREGKPIEVKNEVDTLIALLSRNLYPSLISEMLPPEEGGLGGVYRKDVTDRLKIVQALLNLRHQIDKRDEPDTDKPDTLLTITGKRGLGLDRIGILIGGKPDSLDGDTNGIRVEANDIRALPDTLSERPLDDEDSEQGSPDRVLNDYLDRGSARGDDETEL